MDIDSRSAGTLAQAFEQLGTKPLRPLPGRHAPSDGSGIGVVRKVAAENPETPIAVITAHGNMETAVEAPQGRGRLRLRVQAGRPACARRLVETALRVAQGAPAPGPSEEGELIGKIVGDAGDPAPDRQAGATRHRYSSVVNRAPAGAGRTRDPQPQSTRRQARSSRSTVAPSRRN